MGSSSSSSSLCDQCSGLCCRYFALPLDNPQTVREYDNIRWYLLHENVVVFIEKKQWYIGVMSRCKHLESDNRCGIYHTRPRICREFSTSNCDYHGGDYGFEKLFTSGEQLRAYAEEKLNANRKGKRRISLIPKPKRPRVKKLVANGQLVALSLPVLGP
jgi:Fe-S-cluster containining protein